MTDRIRAIEGLALAAALTAVFDGVHNFGDQFVQNSHDASTKGMHGSHLVYKNDGSAVEENPWRHGPEGRTCTASAYGRRSVSRHVASLGVARSGSSGSMMIAQFSDMRRWAVGARQVSRTEVVAA